MEHFGAWGLIPPLLTIALAFITKDVIISLFLGIVSGVLIVAGGNPAVALITTTDLLAKALNDGWNIRIFLFCALLGGLVGMLSKTGASGALGVWAGKRLSTGKSSQLMAWFFGLVIFIDDYFNSLTVGTIMRPITDKNRVSRAKLSYILDSTAAPVCIIAPISSWVVTVMSVVKGSDRFADLGIGEFEFFIRSIPYNLYALLTILMVVVVAVTNRNFGPMAASERLAREGGPLWNAERYGAAPGDVEHAENPRARAFDMLFPIVVLIAAALVFFPLTTWLKAVGGEGVATLGQAVFSIPLARAFNDTDASVALFYSAVFTLVITYAYYVARRLLSVKTASESLKDGIASMVPALVILTMAWTIGGVIKASPEDGGLGLAKYLAEIVVGGEFPIWLLPSVAFILSALISFSTGTSWGTFTIMIPIVLPIVASLAEARGLSGSALINAVMIGVAAVLSGAVFGDHASPISDTTILSSTGAGCPHLEHVATQLPYALFVAGVSLAGFVVGGIVLNGIAALAAALAIFVLGMVILPKAYAK